MQPNTWKSAAAPEAIGEIILAASPSETGDTEDPHRVVVSRAVLIIRQTRATHDEIVKVIQRIETGDPRHSENQGLGGGMGGFGGGGFGGGLH